MDFQHTAEWDSTLGDASSCTGPDHRVRRSLRRVALVRSGPSPFLAVVDVNEKDGREFSATHLWHTARGNTIELGTGGRFTIRGEREACEGMVLWPPEAETALKEDHGRAQVRLDMRCTVTEVVTVFCPLREREVMPAFSCERLSEGTFRITCERDGARSILELSAATDGPLRQPRPTLLSIAPAPG